MQHSKTIGSKSSCSCPLQGHCAFTTANTDQLEKHMPGWVEGSPEKASLQSCGPSTELQSDQKQMGLLGEIWWKTMCPPCGERLFSNWRNRLWGDFLSCDSLWDYSSHVCTRGTWEHVHDRFDVKTAFLYGKLKEEIYMKQPEGFVMKSQPNKVMRLKCAFYGLKQASLTWWRELEEFMLTIGFKWASSDAGVFVYRHKDGKLVDRKKRACLEHWECRDTGDVKEFLGMQIKKTAHHVKVNQINYLKQILQQFDMTNIKVTKTPLPSGYILQPNTAAVDPKWRQCFQQVIRSMLPISIAQACQPILDCKTSYIQRFLWNLYFHIYQSSPSMVLQAYIKYKLHHMH